MKVISEQPLEIGMPLGTLPALGLQINAVPSLAVLESLQKLNLSYLRMDLALTQANWRDRLNAIAQLGWPIELALHVTSDSELHACRDLPSNVIRLLLFRQGKPMTDPQLVSAMRSIIPNLPIGGGTVGNFTELNRNRPAVGEFDLLNFSITPQVHATDDLSVLENLPAQADIVRTAQSFAGPTPLSVGPVTLHRRPDLFAAGNDGRPLAPIPELRQTTPLAAAWTIGSLKYLSESGAQYITYYDACGSFGVMDENARPYPLYDIFARLSDFAGGEVLQVTDPHPHRYLGLAVRKANRTRLLIANVTWTPLTIPIAGRQSVTLPAHGFTTIDWENT